MSRFAISNPGHNPAQRLHRTRGKKINVEQSFTLAQGRSGGNSRAFADDSARLQDLHSYNPSRGPPTEISL